MSSFAEYTKNRKKKKEEQSIVATSFGEFTKSKLGIDFLEEDDIAPVSEKKTSGGGRRRESEETTKTTERTWFQKGGTVKGFSLENFKSSLASHKDIKDDIYAGIIGMGEKAVDAGAYIIGGVGGLFGADDFQNKMQDFIAKDLYDEHEIADKISPFAPSGNLPFDIAANILFKDPEEAEKYSILGEKTDSLAQSGGQLAATAGLQAVGVPWWLTTGATSFGGETETALKEGATYGEAGLSGAITMGADILTEKISGGIKFGGKTLDAGMTRLLADKISNKTIRTATKLGMDVVGEGSEEVLAGMISNLGTSLYKEENIQELLFSEEAIDEYIEGFVGGAVLGGGVSGASAMNAKAQGRDYTTGLTDNEQKVVDKEVENRIAKEEADGTKVDKKRKAEIKEQVQLELEKGGISIDTIESALGGETYNSYKSISEQEETLKREIERLKKDPRPAMQKRLHEAEVELREIEENGTKSQIKEQLSREVSELAKNDRLAEAYNEKLRRSQQFEADLTKYDAKQQAVVQKAAESGILNNTNKTHEFVDMIAKISADKGVSFDFTNNENLKNSGFAMEGKTVNGLVKDNDIILNIDSSKALNTVVGHEITHVLEGTDLYTELQNAVKEYATTKGEYQTRYDALAKLYEGVEGAKIENELTADLVGEYLFTDSDFINNLSVEKPNIFKKIYEEIKYLVKVTTAGSKEARELEKVKRVFEKAYNQSSSTNENAKYHVSSTFAEEVDKTLNNKMDKSSQVKARDFTPEYLVENGAKDLPMLITQKHIKTIIYSQEEAKKLGLPIAKGINYHGLGKELLIKAIDNMDSPSAVYRKDADNFIIITELTDQNGDTIIVPVRINGKGAYNNVYIDENHITSVYGKQNLQNYLKNNDFKEVDIKRGTALNEGVQYPNISDSSMDRVAEETENVKNNSDKDSEGKKLSKEQSEYFKDSKVRDENGNLKVMYHGTSAGGHTVFDPYGKAKYGLFGVGSYFTDNKSVAESYTEKGKGNNKQVYETYLNITNPIDMDAQANPEAWKKAFPEADFPKSGTNEDFYRAMEEYLSDNEYSKIEATETALDVLESMGYDGITHVGGGRFNKADETKHRVYIAFQPEQIKNVDNTKPTADADIRYSLSEDSEGRKLSEKQQEYFKDSKVVNENGSLAVTYHGSPAEFTVFDKNRIGKGTDQFGAGFYFGTTDKISKAYGENQYEVYLNITNPIKIYRTLDGGDLYEVDITAKQAYEIVKRHPNMYDAEESPLGDFVPEYWEEGPKDWMIRELAKSYTSIGLLDGDLFRDYPNELHEAIKDVIGYDGIEVSFDNTNDKFYIAWFDNQMKLTSNVNPTEDSDIRYSLSKHEQEVAPTGNYNVYGKDIALDIAPVKETVNEKPVQETVAETPIQDLTDDYAPLTEEQANERDALQGDRAYSLNENDMPDEVEAPYYEESTEVVSPFEEKDIQDVGNRKVKAYMYENPEVKPYFQEEAQNMLYELNNSVKGEKSFNDQLYYETGGEQGWFGTKRETSEHIAYMLDRFKYTYADIEKGLKAIIEDHGAENNAISKRLEFMIDERLREGYADFLSGYEVPANQDYINLLTEKQINSYSDEAYNQWLETLAQEYAIEESQVEDIAPTAEYEAIKPGPEKLDALEAQWAKNKMSRVDSKVKQKAEFDAIAEVLDTEPVTNSDRNNRKWAIFRANVFDKGTPFEDLSLKTKNRELMGKWNYTLYSEGRAQHLMGSGSPESGVKSLNDIRAEVENTGHTKQFYEYMYHKHNVDRMKLEERFGIENKPVFGYNVTAEASQEIVDQYEFAQPEFMDYAQDVYNYQDYLRQQLVDNGVISQETADLWSQMYPHYVPIRRVDSTGFNINVPLDTGRTGVNAPIKKAVGGNTDILPLFDTMASRTLQTYRATAKNSFGVELKNTLGTTIEQSETNIDEVIDSVDEQESLLQEGKNGRRPTFTVFENGEKVTFEITEEMYDALKPLGKSSMMSKTIRPLNFASNFHRGLLTEYNPVFMITNGIKDIQDILINSQHAVKTYSKIPEAFGQILQKGYWYNEYMENGGDQNSYFDAETNTFKTENKGIAKILDLPPLSTISKLNNYIENIPRLAEYIASRELGRSIEVSMLDSARVTTNFRAGGNLTKFLNRNGATFLNASVQGAMQQVRNVREANMNGLKGWANLATKFAVAGLPAFLLNTLLWDDDEEYEELSDYVKQNYYIVGKYGDGKFIRIPKGRTVAVIQDAIEQVSNLATGNDEADLKSFLNLVVTNLAPTNPIENNILAPIIQVANNKTWYGEDLVPTRLADLPATEQYDESTDILSRWLGENLNISPVKINYLLDQYSGGVGDVVLPMLTPEAESGDNSFMGNMIAPLKKKFTVDSELNNQNVSDFYETSEELTTNAKKSTATDEDVLKNKYINSVKGEMSNLYAQKREIQNSDLSDAEKYEKVREIQSQITALAEKGLNAYEGVKIEGGYATVGDRHYRKTDEGEWIKVTDKQLEKQEAVTSSLNISASEYWADKEEYDYAYESPEKSAIAKALGGYDTYKAYTSALYDIKADKDSEGKSISGSRKEKVINYIDSLNVDYYEKILLLKSEYPSDDTYNYEIIEYLNNRDDISYSEMETILKELGFTVEADGTVRW